MLTGKACIISVKEKITFDSLWHLIDTRKTRGSKIDPCGTPLDTYAGWENAFPRLTKNVIFMR